MYSSAAGEAVPGVSLYSTCIAVRRVKLYQESAYTVHV